MAGWKRVQSEEDRAAYNKYMREYMQTEKGKRSRRNADYKRNYGISLDDYESMVHACGGLCEICGNPETAIDHRSKELRQLAVDHCHDTGEVRGLLCTRCNTAVGLLQDDIGLLSAAISYLAKDGV